MLKNRTVKKYRDWFSTNFKKFTRFIRFMTSLAIIQSTTHFSPIGCSIHTFQNITVIVMGIYQQIQLKITTTTKTQYNNLDELT